jgi:hypothetical protein
VPPFWWAMAFMRYGSDSAPRATQSMRIRTPWVSRSISSRKSPGDEEVSLGGHAVGEQDDLFG